jgi:NAD(P)-dependent dehydrogenase (short-subunit alcohol dehydrogenase family)
MLRLNLTSAFLTCRAVVPAMIEAGYGRIVNIASNAGKMGTRNNASYAAAKAGMTVVQPIAQFGHVQARSTQQVAPVDFATMRWDSRATLNLGLSGR